LSVTMIGGVLSQLNYKDIDRQALDSMQGWYTNEKGLWSNTNWWSCANALNALIDFSIYANEKSLYITPIQNTLSKNKVFWEEGIDDEGWWGLAWARSFTLYGTAENLQLAEAVFKDMTDYWDNKCGGGVWWNRARTYKNAVTNELFVSLAASLYLRTKNPTYLTWAKNSWAWFESSTMINSKYLINDGLDTNTCKNNGQTEWTYNQGVILGGLADLWVATKNDTLLTVALKIVNATFTNLVYSDGILRESCEVQKNCNGDQLQFKGIYMRNLGYLYNVTKNAQIGQFIRNNANSMWNRARSSDGKNHIGLYWEGPFDSADATRQSSACEALNAALLLPASGL